MIPRCQPPDGKIWQRRRGERRLWAGSTSEDQRSPSEPVRIQVMRSSARRQPRAPDVADLSRGIRAGDRAIIARAITLIESRRIDHQKAARHLVQELLALTGKAIRVGITGAPGVGKSTAIDALGVLLTGRRHKVAVLAIDPSSTRSGGSILADKTRMPRLAGDANAFVRPSPSSGSLGGVAAKTRESMLILEAAGYDCVLVETMGTGQSETVVADMTDFFLVLMLPGAGDELQGMKKGVVELADMIAINKADGDNRSRAMAAAAEYAAALHILTPRSAAWSPPVVTCSALTGEGISQLWDAVLDHRTRMIKSGDFAQRRREQQIKWMRDMLQERMFARLRLEPAFKSKLPKLEAAVAAGRMSPAVAVEEIAALLRL
jgi:LAO/AO transport system kinase